MEKENRVKYGLKNVYYSLITNNGGTITYADPLPVKGAVTISLSAEVERTPIPADDIPEYAVIFEDNGYSGDIEFQSLTDSVRVDFFGNTLGDDGVLIEGKDDTPNPVALMFEFDGDAHKRRHCLYNCLITKPDMNSETGKKNQTDKMKISARPAEDTGYVKASVSNNETGAAVYTDWFDKVYIPDNA